MGTPKALLACPPPSGEPLVRRTARVLREGGASTVLLVVAPGETGEAVAAATADLPDVIPVVNPAPERGMLSSVQAGLARLSDPEGPTLAGPSADNLFWVMICPCDLPLLEPAAVRSVLFTATYTNARIVAPVFAGKRGHPTAFHVSLWPEMRALVPEEFGLNEILKRHPACVHEIAVDGPGVVTDADTPQEWRAVVMGDEGSDVGRH
mgnify:FL=1